MDEKLGEKRSQRIECARRFSRQAPTELNAASSLCFKHFQTQVLVLYFINQTARTSGRTVDKLLNGSRITSHGHFIFGKQSLSLFPLRQHDFPRKPKM